MEFQCFKSRIANRVAVVEKETKDKEETKMKTLFNVHSCSLLSSFASILNEVHSVRKSFLLTCIPNRWSHGSDPLHFLLLKDLMLSFHFVSFGQLPGLDSSICKRMREKMRGRRGDWKIRKCKK